MTTDQGDTTDTTGENGVTSSPLRDDAAWYFACFVVVIGAIGTAANGLVLYAMVASKQHKKHELIFNQNAIDLYSCVFLVIIYGLKFFDIHLSGSLGYWLCMLLFSEGLLTSAMFASWLNLMFISIERYLKVVHAVWSQKKLRKWMTYAAIACTWIVSFTHELAVMFSTSAVVDGVCYAHMVMSEEAKLGGAIYYTFISYVFVLLVFIFCYWKILMVIRRQARVMAGHNPGGSVDRQATVTVDRQSTIMVDRKATILVDRQATITVDQMPLRPNQIRFSPT